MHIPITFIDFNTEKDFLALQNKFAVYDERENPYEPEVYTNVIKQDFSIILKTVDIYTLKDDYIKNYFYKDFLLIQIDKLAKRYIDAFKIDLENSLLVDKEKIKRFAALRSKLFLDLKEQLNDTNYITLPAKMKIQRQIDVVYEYLSNVHVLPAYTFEDKIKVKWKKTDVLLLLLMLRENKFIDHTYDNEFGMLLDKSFLYFNTNDKEFKSLSDSASVINDMKNGSRPVARSLERLKKIFTNPAFYNFPYQ